MRRPCGGCRLQAFDEAEAARQLRELEGELQGKGLQEQGSILVDVLEYMRKLDYMRGSSCACSLTLTTPTSPTDGGEELQDATAMRAGGDRTRARRSVPSRTDDLDDVFVALLAALQTHDFTRALDAFAKEHGALVAGLEAGVIERGGEHLCSNPSAHPLPTFCPRP